MFVCLYGRRPKGRKWVSYKGFCLTSGNRTNVPTSLGRVNPNTAAAEIRTRRLARHQAATRTQADWNSVCPRRNPGVPNAPGWTTGIVRTLCRPFRVFRWFPIYKPSSNSTVLVAWITEPATDSRYGMTHKLCNFCSKQYYFNMWFQNNIYNCHWSQWFTSKLFKCLQK